MKMPAPILSVKDKNVLCASDTHHLQRVSFSSSLALSILAHLFEYDNLHEMYSRRSPHSSVKFTDNIILFFFKVWALRSAKADLVTTR